MLNAFENPARRGLVTELVEPHDIANAVSLNTAVMTGSRIFGPALGAFLVELIGSGWCFVLNGVSFAAVLVSLLLLDRDELHAPPLAPRGGRPVRDALAFVGRRRQLLVTFVVMTIVSTFAFNYGVALPKLADQRWGGEVWFGVVLSVTSVGSFIGSLLTARMSWISTRWYLVNIALLGVAGIGMAWAPNVGVGVAVERAARDRRRRLHQRRQRDHPAGEPARHPRPAARPDRGGVPRLDADRRPDHRVIGDHVGAEWASPTAASSRLVTAAGAPSCSAATAASQPSG